MRETYFRLTTGMMLHKDDDVSHRDELFECWEKFWTEIYRNQGSTYTPSPLDFQRLTFILSVHGEDQRPLGMMGMNFFDLTSRCSMRTPYITSFYDEAYMRAIAAMGKRYVFSCEFLSSFVPKEDKFKVGSITKLVVSGMEKVARMCDVDGMICIARSDNGVSQTVRRMGYKIVTPDVEKRNFKCDLMIHPLMPSPAFMTKDLPEFKAKLQMSIGAENLIAQFQSVQPQIEKIAA